MSWQLTEGVEAYEGTVRPLLDVDPGRNTVALTVLAMARAGALPATPALYGWWRDRAGTVTGAISHTPPHPLLLAVVPDEAVRPLAHALLDCGRQFDRAFGQSALAAHFAVVWTGLTSQRSVIIHAERLYRLGALAAPVAVPGRPRAATAADAPLVARWLSLFDEEAGTTTHDLDTEVQDRINTGLLTLWEVADGTPVSLAGLSRSLGGMVRVGPVYTPPQHRRRSYGAAVTAHVSRLALDAGRRDVVLFTDLANPTSNALYQRLGYRPVGDWLQVGFEPPSGGSDEAGDGRG